MRPATAILAVCRAFGRDFPGQSTNLTTALQEAGLAVDLHPAVDQRFPDGELCIDIPVDPAVRPVLLTQSLTGPHADPDSALLALLATARSYREHGAGPITAFVPHLAYARHDRHVPGQRRPLMAALLGDLAAAAGLDHVMTLASGAQDLLQALFVGSRLTFLAAQPLQLELLGKLSVPPTLLAAPDAGAAPRVRELGRALGVPTLAAEKQRLGPEQVLVTLGGDDRLPANGHAVIVDDLVTSAGTLEGITRALREQSPGLRVSAVATHLRPTARGLERLRNLCGPEPALNLNVTDSAGHRPSLAGLTVSPALPSLSRAVAASFLANLEDSLRLPRSSRAVLR
ncbi:ribose-phosphate pyrophosphokinase-like domain-containing protein [Streptomyces sp. HC307]|uniref:ribose-phosphate pyrophosphokinase-like domain-containing protein n=1 Tax=Streptomyces flavusporus TaxID=3385496 RepID=UPI0039172839